MNRLRKYDVYTYNGVLFNNKGELNYIIWREMSGTGDHHVK
jgi:hypothetical protein